MATIYTSGKIDAVISILETIEDKSTLLPEQITKIKLLINLHDTPPNITANMLFDAWKMADLRPEFHDVLEHRNGWVFTFNRFRNGISKEEYHRKDARISMNIYIAKHILENKYDTPDEIELVYKKFDNKFISNSSFWDYSKLKYIDFDDCYIQDLEPFLKWCDYHKAEELLDLL